MLGAVVLGLGAVLLLAGCGAGQITQTDTQVAAVNGAPANVGKLAIRNAEVIVPNGAGARGLPPGADAGVRMSIINQGTVADKLRSVRTGVASSVSVAGETTVAGENTLVLGPDKRPTPGSVHATVTLKGLKRQLWPGEMVRMTLTFRDAGPVTFDVPVVVPDQPGGGH